MACYDAYALHYNISMLKKKKELKENQEYRKTDNFPLKFKTPFSNSSSKPNEYLAFPVFTWR